MPTEPESLPSAGSTTASSGENSAFTRLHITPLDADLLKIVLPKSAVPHARNISYHTIETFPDRRYGYVELPVAEAEKLRKKLNNAVLKGSKMRIEKARPEERIEPTGEVVEGEEKVKKSKESRKRKRDRELVNGAAITDRKIKRGWTEPADQRRKKSKKDKENEKDNEAKLTEKKKRLKSKYTEGDECLLKTKVPANAVANISAESVSKRRKKKGKARDVVVHEFEKTTNFPSFLKAAVEETGEKPATEFVEGKGWVDEDGNVVQTVKTRPVVTPKPKKVAKVKPVVREPTPAEDDDDSDTSSSGTSSSGTSSDEESEEESEEDEVAEEDGSPIRPQLATPLSAIKADSSRPMSSSSSRSLTIKIPPPITPSAGKVHPLEALYKRNKPADDATTTPAKEAEPFSFFDGDNEDADIEDAPAVNPPMTPFTSQDFEWRNLRSAAPTPDTAHPTRMKNFWADKEDGDEEDMDDVPEIEGMGGEEDEEGEQAPDQAAALGDFQSWFWDNRRDLNRSWMKRRKTAAKDKRHRENKARASRAV